MRSALKNVALVFIGSIMGAATLTGYATLQPLAISPATAAYGSTHAAVVEGSTLGVGEEAATAIYQRLSPAVVNVTNRRNSSEGRGEPFPDKGVGSGVIIDDQGHILTNNHVVEKADQLDVTLADGTQVPAKLVGLDPGDDLAVVRIEINDSIRPKIAVAPLGNSDLLKPGQSVIAIGNPFGYQSSITSGIISSLDRTYATDSGHSIRHMIQTDAAINPGNSGGPLINLAGEVIGINTAIESPVRGFVGIGLAVPANVARQYITEMMAGKTVAHAWLGLSGMTVTRDLAQEAGINVNGGIYVVHVTPNSPAQKAGVQAAVTMEEHQLNAMGHIPGGGDVVTAVDGRPVTKSDNLLDYVDSKRVGDKITLDLLRGGQPVQVQVELAPWPES